MPPLAFTCPACRAPLKSAFSRTGPRIVRCPKCQQEAHESGKLGAAGDGAFFKFFWLNRVTEHFRRVGTIGIVRAEEAACQEMEPLHPSYPGARRRGKTRRGSLPAHHDDT